VDFELFENLLKVKEKLVRNRMGVNNWSGAATKPDLIVRQADRLNASGWIRWRS
jgi:hypothetical protein